MHRIFLHLQRSFVETVHLSNGVIRSPSASESSPERCITTPACPHTHSPFASRSPRSPVAARARPSPSRHARSPVRPRVLVPAPHHYAYLRSLRTPPQADLLHRQSTQSRRAALATASAQPQPLTVGSASPLLEMLPHWPLVLLGTGDPRLPKTRAGTVLAEQ